jgi:hypothetical protein
MNLFTRAAMTAIATTGFAVAQDECATAVAILANVPTAFDNSAATASAETFPCSFNGLPHSNDIWYRYTATSNMDISVNLCGTGFDTLLQSWSGSCGALVPIVCNDDSCALQSAIQFAGVTGQSYYIQVAGWNGAFGVGTITVSEVTPPVPCTGGISTVGYIGGNQGNPGGAIYFDLTVTSAVTIGGIQTNYIAGIGSPVGVTVYTTPTTSVGNEGNMAAWTQVAMDNGGAVAAAANSPTSITFASPLNLAAGSYGIALVASASAQHTYTNGTGANQNFTNGVFSIAAGTASNFPFLAPIFTPRVWNGQLCESGPSAPGTNYCTANVNSTGVTGLISGSGTNVVANNDLTLEASQLPLNAFGYFITSTTQAVTPNPGGSLGILCVGGSIGRYTGAGQIKNTGATGAFSLLLNLNQIPTPTGFVAAMAGQTRSFQTWHRDSVGGMAVSNFTNGYQVTFQ